MMADTREPADEIRDRLCEPEAKRTLMNEEGSAEGGLVFNQADRCNFTYSVKNYAWSDWVQWDFLGYGAAGGVTRFHDPKDQKLEWREMAAPTDSIANG